MLNVQHTVQPSPSMKIENDAPTFVIEIDSQKICESNAIANARFKQSSPIGKKLSEVVHIEKTLGTTKRPAYFDGEWFIATQEAVMLKGSQHFKIKLKDRQRIPDYEVLQSLKDMMGLLLHRVRSPLTGMQGFAGLAKNDLDTEEDAQNYLTKIDDSIDQLLGLLDELEKLQKLSFDSAHGNYSASPESVLQPILSSLPEEDQKQISIAAHSKMSLLPCNPGDLQRILTALLDNAFDYSDSSEITIDQPSPQSIRVSQEGSPIPGSIADHLFAPFVTSQATKLGIGLTMAILYAKRYNGSIFLTSNSLFTGVAFTLCFPPSGS